MAGAARQGHARRCRGRRDEVGEAGEAGEAGEPGGAGRDGGRPGEQEDGKQADDNAPDISRTFLPKSSWILFL